MGKEKAPGIRHDAFLGLPEVGPCTEMVGLTPFWCDGPISNMADFWAFMMKGVRAMAEDGVERDDVTELFAPEAAQLIDTMRCPYDVAQRYIEIIPKSDWEDVRVSLHELQGHHFVDIRVYQLGRDGLYHPTTKGVSIPVKKLHQLTVALRKAEGQATRRG